MSVGGSRLGTHYPFRYFDSSPEIIRLAVMMYIRYPLSRRQAEDLLFEQASISATKLQAPLNFLKRAMKRYSRPETIVTDRLRSYGAAKKVIGILERWACGR